MKEYLKSWFAHPRMGRRVPLLLISVVLMGVCVSVFNRLGVGTDPYSCFNYGASRHLGMSLGNFQAIFGIGLLLIVILWDREQIGIGTIANMILVGYSADFFTWISGDWVPVEPEWGVRILWFIPFALLFLASVACYVVVGLGTSPYDSVPNILYKKVRAKRPGVPFKAVRIAYDTAFALLGALVGGPVGLMTVVCCVGLGPAIDWMAGWIRGVIE